MGQPSRGIRPALESLPNSSSVISNDEIMIDNDEPLHDQELVLEVLEVN